MDTYINGMCHLKSIHEKRFFDCIDYVYCTRYVHYHVVFYTCIYIYLFDDSTYPSGTHCIQHVFQKETKYASFLFLHLK